MTPSALASPASPSDAEFVFRRPTDIATRIRSFRCSSTRMLLSSDGLTTTLLEAWAGRPLRVHHQEHRLVPPAQAPLGAAEVLGSDTPQLLVRRSVLGGADDDVWSVNSVVARLDLAEGLHECFTGSAPLGAALRAAGTGYRRTVVDAGCRPWPRQRQAPAAFKTYVLWHGEAPLAVVCEIFSPDLVAPDLAVPPAREDRTERAEGAGRAGRMGRSVT